MDLKYYINLIRRWLWLLVLMPVIGGAVTYAVVHRQPAVYQASARLLFGPGLDSANPDLNSLKTGAQLMHTYQGVATTGPFLQAVSSELSLGITPDILVGMITVTPNDTSRILTLSTQDSNRDRAVAITNAVANALVAMSPANAGSSGTQVRDQMRAQAAKVQTDIVATETRIKQMEADYQAAVAASQASVPPETQKQIDEIKARIDQMETQLLTDNNPVVARLILDKIAFERSHLAELQPTDTSAQRARDILNQLTSERARLSTENNTLAQLYSLLDTNATNQVKLLEPAVAGAPVAPQLALKALMGSLVAFIVALTIALAAEYFSDILRTAEELSKATGAPLWGSIVRHNRWSRMRHERLVVRALPASRTAESYRLLGTKLLFSNPAAPALHSVLISSAQGVDNTGEIAANVAVVIAQTGARVILVDAELRRPVIAPLFGMVGRRSLADMLEDPTEELELVTFDWAPGLSILPGNPVPSNAFELLASPRMVNLIEQLKKKADILIIAASPLLSFADSLILASHVDGVLLVARKDVINRKGINNTMEHLRSLGAHIVGVVLNDSHRSPVHMPRLATRQSQATGLLSNLFESLRTLGVRLLGTVRHTGRRVAVPAIPAQTIVSVATADGRPSNDGSSTD